MGERKQVTLVQISAGLLVVLSISVPYRWMSIPAPQDWLAYTLQISPDSQKVIAQSWATHPWKLLLPLDHGGGRYAWTTTTLVPMYWLSQYLSPIALYLLVTSAMAMALYLCGWFATKSLRFAITVGIFAAISTFLNYSLVYGNVSSLYLFITYMAIAGLCLTKYLKTNEHPIGWFIAFCISMLLVIFAMDQWLSLNISLLLGTTFIYVWARRRNQLVLAKKIQHISIFLLGSMGLYLAIRMQFVDAHMVGGFESEMVFTYENIGLMLEDVAVNYLTFLFMTLSNILPGFLTFSPSYTYLGADIILDGQNGYHESYSHLVVSSHLSSWRFVAGALIAAIFYLGWRWGKIAWKGSDVEALVPIILLIIVLTGFAIYMPIKMRPMQFTGMLGYKTVVSSTALLVLMAWINTKVTSWNVSSTVKKYVPVAIWALVVIAAFTRPHAQIAGLNAVGLNAAGDPFGRITSDIQRKVSEPSGET